MSEIIDRVASGIARSVGLNFDALSDDDRDGIYGRDHWRRCAASGLDALRRPGKTSLAVAELRRYWSIGGGEAQSDPV